MAFPCKRGGECIGCGYCQRRRRRKKPPPREPDADCLYDSSNPGACHHPFGFLPLLSPTRGAAPRVVKELPPLPVAEIGGADESSETEPCERE